MAPATSQRGVHLTTRPRCTARQPRSHDRPPRLPDRHATLSPNPLPARNSFRYAARQDWDKIAKLLKPVYTAATEEAALERFAEFADAWGKKYPAIVRLWDNAWEEFTPFLRFDTEIRRIVCTTNAIESVNARIRRAVKAREHFPNEQAALKWSTWRSCRWTRPARARPAGPCAGRPP